MSHLTIGKTLLLQCAHFEERHLAVLVGIERGKRLVIYADLPPKALNELQKKPAIQIRYAHEGTLYGFDTLLLSLPTAPGQPLFLTYPQDIQDCDQRREKRLICNFPARLETSQGEQPCLVQDVSASAVRVALPPDKKKALLFEKGEPMRLNFSVISPHNSFAFHCDLLREFMIGGRRFAVLMLRQDDHTSHALLQNWVEDAYASPVPPSCY